MGFLEDIWTKAKHLNKRIVLPETEDDRTLKAAELIGTARTAQIILIGNKDTVTKKASAIGVDLSKAEIIDPLSHPKTERYCEIYMNNMKQRNKSVTYAETKELVTKDYPFFGGLMVADGDADGMVSGASHATAHTIKATVYSVGLKPGMSILSSFFVMILQNKQIGSGGVLFYADCGVVPEPDDKQLVDITLATAQSFRQLMAKEPKIAMLSFSTKGSGRAPSVEKVQKAVRSLQESHPDLAVDGEMQFDAAVVPSIAKSKAPNSKVAGRANIMIFPDLNAGNIAYKITERLAGAVALGPLFQGCNKPVNDLSRGCSVDDIVNISAITAVQAQ